MYRLEVFPYFTDCCDDLLESFTFSQVECTTLLLLRTMLELHPNQHCYGQVEHKDDLPKNVSQMPETVFTCYIECGPYYLKIIQVCVSFILCRNLYHTSSRKYQVFKNSEKISSPVTYASMGIYGCLGYGATNNFSNLSKFNKWQTEDIFLFFPENRAWICMQIVSIGSNLHTVSNPIFWEKIRKIFQNSAEFYPEC